MYALEVSFSKLSLSKTVVYQKKVQTLCDLCNKVLRKTEKKHTYSAHVNCVWKLKQKRSFWDGCVQRVLNVYRGPCFIAAPPYPPPVCCSSFLTRGGGRGWGWDHSTARKPGPLLSFNTLWLCIYKRVVVCVVCVHKTQKPNMHMLILFYGLTIFCL